MGDCLPCHHCDEQGQFSGLHLKQMYLPALKGGRGNAQACGEDKKGDMGERTPKGQNGGGVGHLFIPVAGLPSALLSSLWGFGNAGLALGSQLKFTTEFRLRICLSF